MGSALSAASLSEGVSNMTMHNSPRLVRGLSSFLKETAQATTVTLEDMQAADTEDSMQALFNVLEHLFDEDTLEILDELTLDELEEFWHLMTGSDITSMVQVTAMIAEHRVAIEYDLIALGLRLRNLGSDDFNWNDLAVVLSQSPRSSAFYRSLFPDEAEWGLQEQLMAAMVDYAAVGNWQRGEGKRKDFPDPIPRPGVNDGKERYGTEAIEMDEMAAWLGGEFINPAD